MTPSFFSSVKKLFLFSIALLLAGVFFSGCEKETTLKNESGKVLVQGNFTLKIKAKHHWWGVPYLPVYLKKNATDWPGADSTKYEFMVAADNEGNCEFDHLFPGNYYVYAHGYDPVFGMNVTGYGPIQLNSTTAVNNELFHEILVSE